MTTKSVLVTGASGNIDLSFISHMTNLISSFKIHLAKKLGSETAKKLLFV